MSRRHTFLCLDGPIRVKQILAAIAIFSWVVRQTIIIVIYITLCVTLGASMCAPGSYLYKSIVSINKLLSSEVCVQCVLSFQMENG